MTGAILHAMGKANAPRDSHGHVCILAGSCEWWQGQRAFIANKLVEWLACVHKEVEHDMGKYDYAKGVKELRSLLEYIDNCDGPDVFCGSVLPVC